MKRLLFLFIVIILSSCGGSEPLDEIEVPESLETPCIIYYTSDWCGWCKKFKPNWESVKNDPQYKDINFYENKHNNLFGISGIPALIFIDKNDSISKVVGYHSESKFRNNIKKLIK